MLASHLTKTTCVRKEVYVKGWFSSFQLELTGTNYIIRKLENMFSDAETLVKIEPPPHTLTSVRFKSRDLGH